MKSKVLIYETDDRTLQTLRSFFGPRKDFSAEFVETPESLRERVSQGKGEETVCLVAADALSKIKPSKFGCLLLPLISRAPGLGIRKAIRHGAENYLLSPFHAEDLEYKITTALERRKTMERLRDEADALQAIIDLTYLVTSTLDPQEIFYLIVKKVSEIIPVTRCSIIRVDSDRNRADVVATFENPEVKSIRLDLRRYPEIKKALTSRRPVIINDVTTDPVMKKVRNIIFPLGIRSIIVIPIVFHEEVIGTLFLRTSRAGYSFSDREIKLCHAVANVSANALYNAFLFEKIEDEKLRLEKLAITDYLTGAYNIRYFYHRIREEFSRSQRHGLNLSCLMLDIDFFKKINDEYGHRTGDVVLREFAQVLTRHTRKSDVLARYGGEEFIMLLPQTSERGAIAKAEAIRAYIESYRFNKLKGKRRLTVSIGVSRFPGKRITNTGDLITLADHALYTAKKKGRNQVVVCKQ
ncbi:MAG: sensor domain-containing diguanylate cyclase [Nitrospirae bacterium]|nr:sensor domain-containing diguanylate cyclase [Nitrospirota bacterium]